MSLGRVLSQSTRCWSCQKQVLHSFISSFIRIPEPITNQQLLRQTRLCLITLQSRSISHTRDVKDTFEQHNFSQTSESENNQSRNNTNQQSRTTDLTPWYLQADDKTQISVASTSPLTERQKLPDLPPDPPPILKHLLHYVSVDLGLDYLSFLDLRKVDPPPALGSNLIMIFGSARSPKHVNVSADRLCRWLRSNHNLSPFADGLLGRNELKLKLRRKARRARMLSTAGASESSALDDETATGWICVDVGVVDSGSSSPVEYGEDSVFKFAGFGGPPGGTKIVVQILTESRRDELALENMWREILIKNSKKDSAEHQAAERSPSSQTVESSIHQIAGQRNANLSLHPQLRRYHSISKRFEIPPSEPDTTKDSTSRHILPIEAGFTQSKAPGTLSGFSSPVMKVRDSQANSGVESTAMLKLQNKIKFLEEIPPSDAMQALGDGEGDRSSTLFLREFYQCLPLFWEPLHWHWFILLHCCALKLGHPGYSLEGLKNSTYRMQASAACVLEITYLGILECVLKKPHQIYFTGSESDSGHPLEISLRRSLAFTFEILESMEALGYLPITDELFSVLHEAVIDPKIVLNSPLIRGNPSSEKLESVDPTFDLQSERTSSVKAQIDGSLGPSNTLQEDIRNEETLRKYTALVQRAILELQYIPKSDALFLDMLGSYASKGNWAAFWRLWESMALLMITRSSRFYLMIFRSVTSTGDSAMCQEVLKTRIPEMQREVPVVEIRGSLAVAIRECLVTANAPKDRAPFHQIWAQVETAIAQEALTQ